MAWNQPGDDKKRPARRDAPEDSALDETLRRWQQRVQKLWRPGRGAGAAAIALLALAAAVWLASGYYEIDPAERGVVQRFGSVVAVEQPGHGWHWPWPVETLDKVNVASTLSADSKGLMLSAGQTLLAVSWSVQFRVNNPLQYLFTLREPQATLRQLSETELRQQIASNSAQALLGGAARAQVTSQARDRIQQQLDRLHAGISLTAVALTDVELPDAVLAAQREAQKAQDDRQHAIADAQAYAIDILPAAQSTAQHQLADAQVYASQTVAAAEVEADRFSSLVAAYSAAPEVMRNRLYIDTMESILSRSRKIVIDVKTGGGNMIYLPLDKLADAVRASSVVSTPAVPAASAAPAAAAAAAAAPIAAPAPPASPATSGVVAPVEDDRSRDRADR